MNRADRRRLGAGGPKFRKLKKEDADISDPKDAREYLNSIFVSHPSGNKPLFPIKMDSGRIVDAKSATDEEIMTIVRTIAGNPQ